MAGINAELVTEFAKDKTWEKAEAPFQNQAYIFGEQSYRLSRCKDDVDVIITDSPLPLSIVYNPDMNVQEELVSFVLKTFNTYDNINYFVRRDKPYNPIGRMHTEKEAQKIENSMYYLLEKFHIDYKLLQGNQQGYDNVVNDVLQILKKNK